MQWFTCYPINSPKTYCIIKKQNVLLKKTGRYIQDGWTKYFLKSHLKLAVACQQELLEQVFTMLESGQNKLTENTDNDTCYLLKTLLNIVYKG